MLHMPVAKLFGDFRPPVSYSDQSQVKPVLAEISGIPARAFPLAGVQKEGSAVAADTAKPVLKINDVNFIRFMVLVLFICYWFAQTTALNDCKYSRFPEKNGWNLLLIFQKPGNKGRGTKLEFHLGVIICIR